LIAQIEDAIVALLKSNLNDARIAVQKGFEGIPQPGVYVATDAGRFHKVTQTTWKLEPTIYVDIIFKGLNTEQLRRQALYGMLESCMQLLFLNNLGLPIHPLTPVAFQNVTNEEMLRDGLVAYEFTWTTHFDFVQMGPTDVQDLLTVSFSYYLQESEENLTPGGTDTPDASDLIEVPQ
jgi:hypothetical protein